VKENIEDKFVRFVSKEFLDMWDCLHVTQPIALKH